LSEDSQPVALALNDRAGVTRAKSILSMGSSRYWQLRAQPGEYTVVPAFDAHYVTPKSKVAVSSFGRREYLLVARRNQTGHDPIPFADERIHVLIAAIGLEQEKLAKLTMLSVLESCKRPVKFWFIERFLSPGFKGGLTKWSEKYKFEWKLTDYEWPTWLIEPPNNKEVLALTRLMFIDAMVPFGVQKLILLEPGHLVRSDLAELLDLDLGESMYGFIPLSEINQALSEHFFWKKGFWKDILKGKPYLTSSLGVVDLDSYRKKAGGEMMRIIYQQVIANRFSAENMSAHLPNFAQMGMDIHPLSGDWGWCSTWDLESRLNKAKSIDLCEDVVNGTDRIEKVRMMVPEWSVFEKKAKDMVDETV
jgi:UDP-glucose:glycoprotein glucosyltransferase